MKNAVMLVTAILRNIILINFNKSYKIGFFLKTRGGDYLASYFSPIGGHMNFGLG